MSLTGDFYGYSFPEEGMKVNLQETRWAWMKKLKRSAVWWGFVRTIFESIKGRNS